MRLRALALVLPLACLGAPPCGPGGYGGCAAVRSKPATERVAVLLTGLVRTFDIVHPHDHPEFGNDKSLNCSFDLDRNANILIVVDPTEEKKENFDLSVTDHFVNELVRYLSLKLPSLAVKTAFSGKFTLGEGADASALTCATASAQAGTPTLLLDVRHRPKLTPTNVSNQFFDQWCRKNKSRGPKTSISFVVFFK